MQCALVQGAQVAHGLLQQGGCVDHSAYGMRYTLLQVRMIVLCM